ncbi:MAG: hypothetical protein H0X30_03845 [Anaerolineae bacterium]|nr:hypothetical protein [Anaerolineae bacterium]
MRTSEVAKIIGVESQTILNWLDKPGIADFFSQEGQGIGVKQRSYTNEDVIILNTIRELSIEFVEGKKIDWLKVVDKLNSGYRNDDIRDISMTGDSRSVPMGVVKTLTDIAVITQERDAAIRRTRDLEQQLAKSEDKNERLEKEIRKLYLWIGQLGGKLPDDDAK